MINNSIRELCKQNGITLTELERNLGFGNGTIHKWDSVYPSINKVIKVAEYFNVGVETLINNKAIPTKEATEIAIKYDRFSDTQKGLINCYISLIENGKVG